MEFLQVSGLVACVMKERKRRLRKKSHKVGVRNVVRLDFNWEQHCTILGEDRFLRAYRKKRDNFNNLFHLVERHLVPEERKKNGCSAVGSPRRVTPTAKLSMCLLYLAGGSYLDFAPVHFVHTSTFFKYVNEMMRAIDKELFITFPLDDEALLKGIAT